MIGDCVLCTTDVGGTGANSDLVDMQGCDSVYFNVLLGCTSGLSATGWDPADTLDTCNLIQAQDIAGTGLKTLGGTPSPINDPSAAGEKYTLEAKAIDLDIANGFRYVGVAVGENDNTGVDNVTIFAVRHNLDKGYANADGAIGRGNA